MREVTAAPAKGRRAQSIHFGLWLSLVERLVRDQEAVGSNPTSPMKSLVVERCFIPTCCTTRKPGDDTWDLARNCVIRVYHGLAALHLATVGDSSASLNGSWFVAGVSRH